MRFFRQLLLLWVEFYPVKIVFMMGYYVQDAIYSYSDSFSIWLSNFK